MTHGETYFIEYAPNSIRAIAGLPPHTPPREPVTSLPGAQVYMTLYTPMLKTALHKLP